MRRHLGSMTTVILLTGLACVFLSTARAEENNAIVPVPKLENDFYDWYARHAQVLKVKDAINPEIVLIGDSITHLWGGEPAEPRKNGPKAWADVFGDKRVLNLGFGWDRTQNVLWRLDNGEFDGLQPKFVVLHIGTNNFSGTKNARENTPAEVAEGIAAICERIKTKSPETKIILMAVFPRGGSPKDGFRPKIAALNALLAPFAKEKGLTYLDIGPKMLRGRREASQRHHGRRRAPDGKRLRDLGGGAKGSAGEMTAKVPATTLTAKTPKNCIDRQDAKDAKRRGEEIGSKAPRPSSLLVPRSFLDRQDTKGCPANRRIAFPKGRHCAFFSGT